MDSREPIYRQVCISCARPALTLDQKGEAYCVAHADVFIAAEDTTVVLGDSEITVLLIHRSLVAEVG